VGAVVGFNGGFGMKFSEYFDLVQEKAGQRMDRTSVRYMFDAGKSVMDAVVALTYRRG
jgi:hypothetical protein